MAPMILLPGAHAFELSPLPCVAGLLHVTNRIGGTDGL